MFKSVWDLVIIVVICGLVSTFEIGLLGSVIGKIIESKMKVHYEMEIKYYEKIMDRFDQLTEYFFDRLDKSINDSKVQPTIRKIGFDESEK